MLYNWKYYSFYPNNFGASALISESGLLQATTARCLRDIGYKGFLVGEAFMKTTQPGEILHDYINTLKA